MYKVLYRKYRPQFFADVVGQPQVTVTLQNELARGRVAHAYLFAGCRGTGKTTCARILARAINCLHPVEGGPCGQCEICRGLEDGSLLDVEEIDAASNSGVESVRGIIEGANFTPVKARYRVYIIDEVHALTPNAFTALLKTLEEPPPHVVFILATTEAHRLLPTVLSRCQRFDFHRIDPALIADRLVWVAAQEEARLDRDAAMLIARIADGALRDALSLLDQCLGRSHQVTAEVVQASAGLADQAYLAELAGAVAGRDAAGALACVDRLHQESKDLNRLCAELAGYFRGMMLFKLMRDPGQLVQEQGPDRQAMEAQAAGLSLPDLLHGLACLEDVMGKMRFGDARTQLEMALVRLCSPQLDSTPDGLLRRLEALEKAVASGIPAPAPALQPPPQPAQPAALAPQAPAGEDMQALLAQLDDSPPPAQQPRPQPQPQPKPPAPPKPAPAPREGPARGVTPKSLEELSAQAVPWEPWGQVLDLLRQGEKSLAEYFKNSTAYTSGNYMLIDAPEFAFELLRRSPRLKEDIRRLIVQITGRNYRLGPYKRAKPAEQDPIARLVEQARAAGVPVEEEDGDS
ncbi:DNA polymerase III subunit gamma/tau [Acutalibacter caecimuris]|uniref:DNA polymerase III subunit gamma/tau n=1 Tax=Acutalibacter caecimuris TaxID=3093657 RepID=UPI002AC971B4|nr:DNA polymerase III subunit gamma/tau [Acutalibacter sp. M00118]